ncbi:DUF6587 family protein [Trinickia sp.]|uniref:DUF6587 family protein n=1 Tax=Trinickia sp. TaxID=2571163 RepID=UPI0039C9A5FE
MSTGLWTQYALVCVAVAASIAYMFRKLAPGLAIRSQAMLSAMLSSPRRSPNMQRLGRALKPREASGDCGSGCGSCKSCGSATSAHHNASEQPLTFSKKPSRT